MSASEELLISVLEGWQEKRDPDAFVNMADLSQTCPEVVSAYREIERAERNFELIIKGLLRDRNA